MKIHYPAFSNMFFKKKVDVKALSLNEVFKSIHSLLNKSSAIANFVSPRMTSIPKPSECSIGICEYSRFF